MPIPQRTYTVSGGSNYRYGFNGKENDNEVKGTGNQIDFGARVYDARVGRWLSVDPLQKKYPWISPYNYCSNTPTLLIDPDGRENTIYIVGINGQSKELLAKIADHINKNFQEMGLKTQAVVFEGSDFSKYYPMMDKTDAVAVIGSSRIPILEALNQFNKTFADYVRKFEPTFGTSDKRYSPEVSQNPIAGFDTGPGDNIVLVSTMNSDVLSRMFNVKPQVGETEALLVTHGLGHNAGLAHAGDKSVSPRPSATVDKGPNIMSSADEIAGAPDKGPSDYVKAPSNKNTPLSFGKYQFSSVIYQSLLDRFGDKTSKPVAGIPIQASKDNK